ncbi:MAG TPA: hypothetical protein VHB54_08170 [Mucilaginibacter sp.]|nr:hypothetical protein [Mucilaginibacter sp.]
MKPEEGDLQAILNYSRPKLALAGQKLKLKNLIRKPRHLYKTMEKTEQKQKEQCLTTGGLL